MPLSDSIDDAIVSKDDLSDIRSLDLRDDPTALRESSQFRRLGENRLHPLYGGACFVPSDIIGDFADPIEGQGGPDYFHAFNLSRT